MIISYNDHVMNVEVHSKIQGANGVHNDLLTMNTKLMVLPLKIPWRGKDHSAGNSKRSKNEGKMKDEE